MIAGVVLAAGASLRMGMPKALLTIGERTFLQHIVEVLYSARILNIVVVLGADVEKIQSSLSWFTGKIVINDEWERGQLSSIITGIDALDDHDISGVMICPVDHPLISQGLLVDLLQAFWKSKKKIILPTFQGRRGHPVIFAKEMFDELRNAPMNIGARIVLHNHPDETQEVPTDEEGILVN
ncbi:MAG: nucleotidyltransferase family protein, partial [Ignavibacteriae bacterium]|nr:nucleotidyltransferase family protein [Ignavibacteriota bacterium]